MPSARDKARRWWQFSIRELLFCTAVVGLAFGWWADRASTTAAHNLKVQRLQTEMDLTQEELVSARIILKGLENELVKYNLAFFYGTDADGRVSGFSALYRTSDADAIPNPLPREVQQ